MGAKADAKKTHKASLEAKVESLTEQKTALTRRVVELEEECEALRVMVSRVAKGGEGAVL